MFGWLKSRSRQQAVWSPPQTRFMHLVSGRTYRVVQSFTDFDGGDHPIGETWRFEGHSFLPYEDGLSLFISPEPNVLRHIRMRWTPQDQGPIVDALANYVQPAD